MRYAVLVATPASSSRKYRTSSLLHPVQPGTGIQHQRCRSGQLPGVERLDGTLTSAATSSSFTDFPLLISGLDGFQYINHSSAVSAASAPLLPALVPARSSLVQCFQWSEHQKQPEFRCPGNMRQAVACTTSDIFKVGSAPRITVPSAITASYLPVLASHPPPAAAHRHQAPKQR